MLKTYLQLRYILLYKREWTNFKVSYKDTCKKRASPKYTFSSTPLKISTCPLLISWYFRHCYVSILVQFSTTEPPSSLLMYGTRGLGTLAPYSHTPEFTFTTLGRTADRFTCFSEINMELGQWYISVFGHQYTLAMND